MKLDFSQAKVQAVGTAFWAMSANVNTKTKQQLEEEESIGQTSCKLPYFLRQSKLSISTILI